MKAVLMSIKPKWVEKILSGEKTIEVRKTKPKLDTPFKVYIYCTKGNSFLYLSNVKNGKADTNIVNGKVVAEFTCDDIKFLLNDDYKTTEFAKIIKGTTLNHDELCIYMGNGSGFYLWHIADLKIYDKPKDLDNFTIPCPYKKIMFVDDCKKVKCKHLQYITQGYTTCNRFVEKAPQSWCYVEELQNE